ncbi:MULTISPECIES: hypothetical protein [unclassified Polaromonas]|uniref:hypothetical protein n=1 Tax=unclassified Polaromonas TaxID=2638319 RepID=UPI000BD7C162|nr:MULTISPECIES: hypothetical protein [unclassified Polaromonas]OYY37846.1 MAG: hypothetical protein B7Y60_05375 [Polaromonas sp. 35-63-35]OYZ18018.1 MAG: hypothetical protein B7Y28_17730 [Polaromonas sp. 16-63-31]OYZ79397.1 MAG: hypothetical protein B7Y09_07485 [Polaromonas sp. 24-63-21]OZA50539.1 MAG: hypothetical protein B7X88_09695 [Polaromonas sp. 17-63-33]OZA85201.1 MAG: hypothetical protein B7X65_22555 [Polaromonas sp. 39-63-25]
MTAPLAHGPASRHIALLGAAGTGKTRLAGELRAALDSRPSPHPALLSILIADNPPLATVRQARAGAPTGPRGFGFDQVLLMGLDLPVPAGLAAAQEAVDQQLRLTLANAELPYTVVYGQGPQRLAHALGALQGLLDGGKPHPLADDSRERKPWVWACDTCSDPGCERRLLSDLLERRLR